MAKHGDPTGGRITIELTNYCPNGCKYCSSDATTDYDKTIFVKYEDVIGFLASHDRYDTIILSGGEPLAHPQFYNILRLCKQRTDHVVVYTNELSHIVYNAGVIDGVRVDANITVLDSTNTVKILKRVEQGREAKRPDVTFSKNFDGDCRGCGESVLLPNGTIAPSPCKKDAIERPMMDSDICVCGLPRSEHHLYMKPWHIFTTKKD